MRNSVVWILMTAVSVGFILTNTARSQISAERPPPSRPKAPLPSPNLKPDTAVCCKKGTRTWQTTKRACGRAQGKPVADALCGVGRQSTTKRPLGARPGGPKASPNMERGVPICCRKGAKKWMTVLGNCKRNGGRMVPQHLCDRTCRTRISGIRDVILKIDGDHSQAAACSNPRITAVIPSGGWRNIRAELRFRDWQNRAHRRTLNCTGHARHNQRTTYVVCPVRVGPGQPFTNIVDLIRRVRSRGGRVNVRFMAEDTGCTYPDVRPPARVREVHRVRYFRNANSCTQSRPSSSVRQPTPQQGKWHRVKCLCPEIGPGSTNQFGRGVEGVDTSVQADVCLSPESAGVGAANSCSITITNLARNFINMPTNSVCRLQAAPSAIGGNCSPLGHVKNFGRSR